MGRFIKVFLIAVGAFIAVFLLAAILLYLFFDPNDFREDIANKVREQTGRELTIEGDISLDIFPWIAVQVGKSSLGNAQGFGDEPMASFDSASFSVRLMPAILRQEVVVGAADIVALNLNLEVDRNGNDNWSDLVSEESSDAADEEDSKGGGLDINSIEIVDAKITYRDGVSGDVIVIDQANLNIGRLKDDGSAVPLDATLNFDMQPAGMSGLITLNSSMVYDADSGELRLGDFLIDGSLEGVASIPTSLRMASDNITVSTNESTAVMDKVDIRVLDMHIVADVQSFSYASDLAIKANVAIDTFSPRSVMHLFDVEPPVTADPAALSSLTMNATADMSAAAIKLTGLSIKLDDTSFTGTLSVPRTDAGFYEFDLNGDSIDLNRYMEPPVEGGSAGPESAPVEIPTDLIAPLKARGKLKLAKATLGNIVFENVELGVNTNGGKMRIFPVSSDLFGGAYQGDVRIDVAGSVPKLSMNEKIEGVNLAKLAKAMFDEDNVTGTVGGSFVLAGSGKDMMAIQRDLAGNIALELKDGTYEGTDIWYELRRARAVLKREEPPTPVLPPRTAFSTATVSGVVAKGVMKSDDLYAELPFMQLTGGGQVDLAEGTINYNMSARVLERPEFLKGATPEELDEFTEAVIPLKITGTLESPKVAPDIEKLLKKKVEDELKDKLKDKLKGLFD